MLKRWPLHPAPRKYESLLDWIKRLADAYGVSLTAFSKHALCIPLEQVLLINQNPSEDTLTRLEAGTGIPIEQLRDMTGSKIWMRLSRDIEIEIEQNPDAFKPLLERKLVDINYVDDHQ